MSMTRKSGNTFVPNGKNRRETAVLLVGTAAEHGLPDDAVFAVPGGFYISDALAEVLDAEGVEYSAPMAAINNGVETGGYEPYEVSGNDSEGEEGETFDPADHTVEEVKAEVTEADDSEFASEVLAAEQDGKNRTTLVEWLTEFIDNNTSEEE